MLTSSLGELRRARFQPEASSELREAARWYEARCPGFGLAFLAKVDDAIEMVVSWPDSGAPVAGVGDDLVLRPARVHRFPYHVGYMHTDDEILVLAIGQPTPAVLLDVPPVIARRMISPQAIG